MASFSPIRSVERALDVLLALNRTPVCTLDHLYRQTGLPKPTLVRLLETLEGKGMVVRAPQYGAYSLASGVKTLSDGYHGEPRIVEAAMPPMNDLTRLFKWPVALAVPDYDAVVIRYSTIAQSPLALLHSSVNMRLSMVGRALGRAYLAFCTHAERQALLEVLQGSEREEDALARDRPQLQALLQQDRAQGFSTRMPGVRPVSNTLAVPVRDGRRVVASVGLTWISSALTEAQARQKFLQPLQETAGFIKQRLARI